MRRNDREITDKNKIKEIISKSKVLHLGLFDEIYPYIVPLHFGYEFSNDTIFLFVHGAKEGHKIDLINKILMYALNLSVMLNRFQEEIFLADMVQNMLQL